MNPSQGAQTAMTPSAALPGGVVDVPFTHREPWPGAQRAGDVDPDRDVVLTIWLRPGAAAAIDPAHVEALGRTPPHTRTYLTRSQLRATTDADPGERFAVEAFCRANAIDIVRHEWRSLVVTGKLGSLIAAFGASVDLSLDINQHHFRHRVGPVRLPAELATVVRGVFGFHQWPHSARIGSKPAGTTPPLSSAQIAQRYEFPADADGTGQTIGVLQLGGTFSLDDFHACMTWQNGAQNDPIVLRIDDAVAEHATQTNKDIELALDTQIVGALAPGARIVIYQAPNDERGFLDAIRETVFDEVHAPHILSISFGWSEHVWTPVALDLLAELAAAATLVGMTLLCSSGDEGAQPDPLDGKLYTEVPASLPFVLACGATVVDVTSGIESAWSSSSGGFSGHFATPAWQLGATRADRSNANATGRGVPDIAAQQDPGYAMVFDGVRHRAHGTSAVAPMMAALVARLNERIGVPIGFFAPLLYTPTTAAAPTRDVTSGSNGAYTAHSGWNCCTGLGVPNAAALEAVLRG